MTAKCDRRHARPHKHVRVPPFHLKAALRIWNKGCHSKRDCDADIDYRRRCGTTGRAEVGLSLAGFTTDAIETCDEANAVLIGHSFDAIVLDLMLPDGSGLDILKALRERGDKIPCCC